ncbi:MAG: hypothetical protein GX182_07650 [Firmicutes bacterium]|mgnify:CR=1 FL=1|jgi:hypothetical protein|nr:hypothetical protein [Bacillota bacterium]
MEVERPWRRRIFPVLILLLLLTGCGGERVRVEVPPKVPTEGIETIAILEFANESEDPGLAREMELALMDYFRDRGQFTLVEGGRLQSYRSLRTSSPSRFQQLGADLGVDAFIIASATYYLEDVDVEPPRRYTSGPKGEHSYWVSRQVTTVIAKMVARVVDAQSGMIIYSKGTEGRGEKYQNIRLPDWPGSSCEPPPFFLLPRPNRTDVYAARRDAIRSAVVSFAQDFYPTYKYVRVED